MPSAKPAIAELAQLATAEGVQPILKVLYVPDYVPRRTRTAITAKLFRQLSGILPGYTIRLAIAEGPFEDDHGVGAHFDSVALKPGLKQLNQLKVDFHVSVIKLARAASMHRPRLIIGEGQGGLIALGYSHPGLSLIHI